MADVKFYSISIADDGFATFSLVHVLPQKTAVSVNARHDFNDVGYFELDFFDDELCAKLRDTPELLVVWDDFQGFTTGYTFAGKKKKVFGLGLNGLLMREVINDLSQPAAADVETLLYDKISDMKNAGKMLWLTLRQAKGCFTAQVNFYKETCVRADTWVQELLACDNAGYRISADIAHGGFTLEVLPRKESTLIVSESNRNAYDITINYDGKTCMTGGWYKDADGTWHYVQSGDATGVRTRDAVLSANTESDALNEIAASAATEEVSMQTARIKFLEDYNLGDIVRVQTVYGTQQKVVRSVFVSSEGANRIERPEFEEAS